MTICLFWNLCWNRPTNQPRYRIQEGLWPNHKQKNWMLEIRFRNSWKVKFLVLVTIPFSSFSILTSLVSRRFLLFLYSIICMNIFCCIGLLPPEPKILAQAPWPGKVLWSVGQPPQPASPPDKVGIKKPNICNLKYQLYGSRKKCGSTLLCFRIIQITTPMISNASFRTLLLPVLISLTLKARGAVNFSFSVV